MLSHCILSIYFPTIEGKKNLPTFPKIILIERSGLSGQYASMNCPLNRFARYWLGLSWENGPGRMKVQAGWFFLLPLIQWGSRICQSRTTLTKQSKNIRWEGIELINSTVSFSERQVRSRGATPGSWRIPTCAVSPLWLCRRNQVDWTPESLWNSGLGFHEEDGGLASKR